MSRIGVLFEREWWDVIVVNDSNLPLKQVYMVRDTRRKLLCQLDEDKFGWNVVVAGSDICGLRLVQGFKTRWRAIEYAINIRLDINQKVVEPA